MFANCETQPSLRVKCHPPTIKQWALRHLPIALLHFNAIFALTLLISTAPERWKRYTLVRHRASLASCSQQHQLGRLKLAVVKNTTEMSKCYTETFSYVELVAIEHTTAHPSDYCNKLSLISFSWEPKKKAWQSKMPAFTTSCPFSVLCTRTWWPVSGFFSKPCARETTCLCP